MSHRVVRFNRFLIIINLALLAALGAYIGLDYFEKTIETSRLVLKNSQGQIVMEMVAHEEGGVIALPDQNGVVRLQLQGGSTPAVMLSGPDQKLIATLFTLQDGGAGLGLGDQGGDVAAFLRGGFSPSIGFYQKSSDPNVAMGISNRVPHFVLTPESHKERMLIHGGNPTSLLFINEKGEIPVTLSKYGLNQEKEKSVGPLSFEQAERQSLQELSLVQ